MSKQDFRFCCQRLSLIINKKCFFCQSSFIMQGSKADFNNVRVQEHYKNKKQKIRMSKL